MNVSHTDFNTHGLDIVCDDLPHIESLDISCTSVDDISPLRRCKDRLKSLKLYNLKVSPFFSMTSEVGFRFKKFCLNFIYLININLLSIFD